MRGRGGALLVPGSVTQCGQSSGGSVARSGRDVASVRGVAVAEWTDIGIAQQRQMGVGMVHPPRAHPGAAVEAEELPRPPQRLEALDGFGVVPPLRAPLEGALYLAFEVRAQPPRHPGGTVRKGPVRVGPPLLRPQSYSFMGSFSNSWDWLVSTNGRCRTEWATVTEALAKESRTAAP